MTRTGRYFLVAALMISIGAQWAVLQSAAWVGMAVNYSLKSGSVKEGLSETFDGQHPCALCLVVNKGKQSEKKDPTQTAAKLKLDLICDAHVLFEIVPVESRFPHTAKDEAGLRRPLAPSLRPPRGGVASI